MHAQEASTHIRKAPISIYTFNSLRKDVHSISSIGKRLNINPFCLVIPNNHNVDQKIYPLNFKEIGAKTTAYV